VSTRAKIDRWQPGWLDFAVESDLMCQHVRTPEADTRKQAQDSAFTYNIPNALGISKLYTDVVHDGSQVSVDIRCAVPVEVYYCRDRSLYEHVLAHVNVLSRRCPSASVHRIHQLHELFEFSCQQKDVNRTLLKFKCNPLMSLQH
jgi:hypothetical protein